METRRGRRPAPVPWRRAALSTAILALATAGAAATVRLTASPQHAVQSRSAATVTATPEDDTGGFVDPTAPPIAEAAQTPTPALPAGRHITLPILLYHYVRVNPVASDRVGFQLSVTPRNFALQMGFLRYIGAHTVTLADAMQSLTTGKPLPPRSVVLTFDDGYTDFATQAAPVMHYDGLRGITYVVSGFVGRAGYMNAQQVLAVQDMGMVIGCHTVNHVDLASIPLSMAKTQIEVSHRALDQLTGGDVLDFAYPYGGFDAAVEKLVQADGFRDAVTTDPGAVLYQSQAMAWPRYRVGGYDTVASFAHKALLGVPQGAIDQLVQSYLASPDAAASQDALPAPHHTVVAGDPTGIESSRRV